MEHRPDEQRRTVQPHTARARERQCGDQQSAQQKRSAFADRAARPEIEQRSTRHGELVRQEVRLSEVGEDPWRIQRRDHRPEGGWRRVPLNQRDRGAEHTGHKQRMRHATCRAIHPQRVAQPHPAPDHRDSEQHIEHRQNCLLDVRQLRERDLRHQDECKRAEGPGGHRRLNDLPARLGEHDCKCHGCQCRGHPFFVERGDGQRMNREQRRHDAGKHSRGKRRMRSN